MRTYLKQKICYVFFTTRNETVVLENAVTSFKLIVNVWVLSSYEDSSDVASILLIFTLPFIKFISDVLRMSIIITFV